MLVYIVYQSSVKKLDLNKVTHFILVLQAALPQDVNVLTNFNISLMALAK
jgi:hypothetical protein